jgi:hypothetical protein
MAALLSHASVASCDSLLFTTIVFRRKLDLSSLLIMEIMAIHSWKSQYIYIRMVFGYDLLCDFVRNVEF